MQHQTIDRKARRIRFIPIHPGGHGATATVASSLEGQTACLFRRLGYRVRRRPTTHDLGVDLALTRPGLRAIVQCKDWSRPVGPSVVRDLYGTLLHTGANLGILATSSTISRSTRRFAAGKPLLLLDGSILRVLLHGLQADSDLGSSDDIRYTSRGSRSRGGRHRPLFRARCQPGPLPAQGWQASARQRATLPARLTPDRLHLL